MNYVRGEGGYGLASRDVQARVVAKAELSAKNWCFEREPWFIKPHIGGPAFDLGLCP